MAETIIHDKQWRPSSMIVWGGFARRGTTVHLPGVTGAYGASTGATAACDRRARPPILCAWSFRFGGPAGGAVHLCRRCFPDGKPNRKFRPAAGWLRYAWPRRARADQVHASPNLDVG
jgi:hypothetical protein